jgi:hypothetical protein
VVAEGEHVRARGEQPLGELRGDPSPVGDVLTVDDAEAGAELFLQRPEAFLERGAAGGAEDVGDEEDLQRPGFLGEGERGRVVR